MKKDLVVLAVDDDLINLKLLKSMLVKTGMVKEVVEARNGSDAIGALKNRNDIDIILLDIVMPIMNGIEVLKVVRADDTLRQLPVIILTTDETKKLEALDHGANGFLTKPIRYDDLVRQINQMIV